MLLKYENAEAGNLYGEIDTDALSKKLAAWYMSLLPQQKLERTLLESTNLDLRHFHHEGSSFPSELKVWVCADATSTGEYNGATHDSKTLMSNAMRDTVEWDRKLAMTGCLPDSYKYFLAALGHPASATTKLKNEVSNRLRTHTKQILRKYWKLMAQPNVSHTTALPLDQNREHDGIIVTMAPTP